MFEQRPEAGAAARGVAHAVAAVEVALRDVERGVADAVTNALSQTGRVVLVDPKP